FIGRSATSTSISRNGYKPCSCRGCGNRRRVQFSVSLACSCAVIEKLTCAGVRTGTGAELSAVTRNGLARFGIDERQHQWTPGLTVDHLHRSRAKSTRVPAVTPFTQRDAD